MVIASGYPRCSCSHETFFFYLVFQVTDFLRSLLRLSGYMTEALSLVLNHLFTELRHPVDAVTASIFAENVASERLLKKLGFSYDHSLENGMQVYRLGKDKWMKRTQSKDEQ